MIIAALHIDDGSGDQPGATLQYGIGEVPEAVTTAIVLKGVRDLAIHTELFSGAMARLVQEGIVTNRWKNLNFSISSIFLRRIRKDTAGSTSTALSRVVRAITPTAFSRSRNS